MEAVAAGRDVVPTLVLCCAKDTRHLLPPALELLASRGFQVEVVSGLEQRDDAVVVTAQRKRDAVYVLFESAELGPQLIVRVKGRLVAAGVRADRIASMPLDWRGPLDVVARVEQMGIIPPITVRRATHVGLPSIGSVVSADVHIPAPGPRPIPGPPPVRHAVAPPPPPASVAPPAALLSGSVPVLDSGDDLELAQGGRRRLVVVAAVLGSIALLLGGVAMFGLEETPPPAVAAAASPPVQSKPTPAPAVEAPVVDVPEIEAMPEPENAVEDVDHGPLAPTAMPIPPVPGPVAVASPMPAAGATPTVPPASAPVPGATAITGVPETAPTVAKPPTTPPPPEEDEVIAEVAPEIDEAEMQAIYEGLIAQKFRALDILLIAPEPKKKKGKKISKLPARMTFAQAAAHCAKLEVAGVSGWRLPRVGELGSITDGSLIADGKFWSQTEGDTFGKSRVVWNTQTSKMGSAPVRWNGGRVVCVRTMARPPEPAAE